MRETGDLLMEIGQGGRAEPSALVWPCMVPSQGTPNALWVRPAKVSALSSGSGFFAGAGPKLFFFLLLHLSTLRLHKNLYLAYSLFKKSNEGSALKRAGPGP